MCEPFPNSVLKGSLVIIVASCYFVFYCSLLLSKKIVDDTQLLFTRTYCNSFSMQRFPEDPIRSVDPIVFNRIRVGFHRKPTSFIKNRSDPTQIIQIRPP
jgi:hypothetical protein